MGYVADSAEAQRSDGCELRFAFFVMVPFWYGFYVAGVEAMARSREGPKESGEAYGQFELSAVANKSKSLSQFVMGHLSITNWPFSRVALNSAPS